MHHRWRTSIAPILAVGVFIVAPGFGQELGNAQRGLDLAQSTCTVCHGTRKGETSANRQAPPFDAIAQVKGMSPIALNVALLSSHRSMPNIVLDAKECADVIAYILTLKPD
jgi:mono/diheme cytochrome c family protein